MLSITRFDYISVLCGSGDCRKNLATMGQAFAEKDRDNLPLLYRAA